MVSEKNIFEISFLKPIFDPVNNLVRGLPCDYSVHKV